MASIEEQYEMDDKAELTTFYGLPREVKFCKKCVMSNQKPNSKIEFKHGTETPTETMALDEEGICSACRFCERKDNEFDWQKREQMLRDLCDKHRRNDGRYDCIVPGSGGKDSVFASWILKHKYGMHPLTVTWAPTMYTEVGWRNFNHWIEAGFDNVLIHPNGRAHKILTRLAVKNLLHPFQPFILGQKNIGWRTAKRYDVKLVFYGEMTAEYGNNPKRSEVPTRRLDYNFGEDLLNLKLGGMRVQDIIDEYGFSLADLMPYLPDDPEYVKGSDIEIHQLGYYVKWDPQESYYFAVEKTGFEANDRRTEGSFSKYSSLDDKADVFHYWTSIVKFGQGRCTYDASQEVRNKKIAREEAVALVKKYDAEYPQRYLKDFLEYIDMAEAEFLVHADNFRSPHLWKRVNGEWKLRHPVWEESNGK